MYRVNPPRTNHPEHIDNFRGSKATYYFNLNFIYIAVDKNASTAIDTWGGPEKSPPIGGMSELGSTVRHLIPKLFIIRNPIDRVVSSFFEVMKLVRANKFRKTLTPEEENKFLEWAKQKYNLIDSFNMFLKSISNNNFYDTHTFPQISYLDNSGFDISEVSPLLFENLGEELNEFCKKYNILNPKKFLILNKTMNPRKKEVQEYVNSNTDIQNKIKEFIKKIGIYIVKLKNLEVRHIYNKNNYYEFL